MATGVIKSATRAARTAYLYGQGDGKRIVSVRKLCELFDLTENTVKRHVKEWDREFAAMASESTELGAAMALNAETLAFHKATTENLQSYIVETKQLIKTLPEVSERLEEMLAQLLNAKPRDYKACCEVFKSLCSSMLSKQASQKHLIALQKAWKENAGIDALQDVSTHREKALTTGRIKAQLLAEREENAGNLPPAAPAARAGRFAVEAVPVQSIESAPDDDMEGL